MVLVVGMELVMVGRGGGVSKCSSSGGGGGGEGLWAWVHRFTPAPWVYDSPVGY